MTPMKRRLRFDMSSRGHALAAKQRLHDAGVEANYAARVGTRGHPLIVRVPDDDADVEARQIIERVDGGARWVPEPG